MESDRELVTRLRAGDEQAFVSLVQRYHDQMVRLASSFVPNRAVAEEVVQDTWVALLRGIEGFEGRSSLRTWLFRVLINQARSTGTREQRTVPVADPEPAIDPARFDRSGGWADPPDEWPGTVMSDHQLAARVRAWIDLLPPRQRQVVLLRDVEGLTSDEVRDVLAISEANQRVLLHRGRSRVRRLLETELREVR